MTDPLSESIPAIFEQVVARHPDKSAIERPGLKVSFDNLNRAANAIAARLLAENVQSPSRVALWFKDRLNAIAAILGVLKAGHAYVPLDSADPEERVRFILQDCEPFALLTDDDHMAEVRQLIPKSCRLIHVNQLDRNLAASPLPQVSPDACAYLFYTSGSTGQPKGVCQSQRNLSHFVNCYRQALCISADDRLSLLYSLSFSAANMDIYSGLLTGATICSYDVRRNGIAPLANWLDAERITVLHTVPTVFRRLTQGLDPQRRLTGIRAVDLGGETVFASDVPLFQKHFAEEGLLVNHLAATEASVIAQYVVTGHHTDDGQEMLPVGRCPEGVRVQIRRPDNTEAAVDEEGEIVVSSPFISPGYWRRNELNSAVFSDDPDHPGWRVYRTGDRGRITPDHNLVFGGRTGTRVKIRGQSVDLAEVEAGLRRCNGVTDAAVIATNRDHQQEADKLVAYLVVASQTERDPKKVRRQLAKHLPSYMLPSAYIFLEALPQTATGKIDRQSLSKVNEWADQNKEAFEPPHDELEAQIAGVFQKLLNYSPVGREDDFFLNGGDSVTVQELNVLLVNLFGNHVPDLFEETTVAGLAQAIRSAAETPSQDNRQMPVLIPRRKQGTPPILFLVHGRRGQAHVGSHFLGLLGEDQPLYAFQARGVDGVQPPNETIQAMAEDYISAMKSIQFQGPYFLAGLCSGGYVAIKMAQLLRARGESVGPLILIDPPVPPFTVERANQNIRSLGSGLRALQQRGNVDMDFNDPNRRKGAQQVVVSFEKALVNYRPEPYTGEVFLLATREKLSEAGWGNPAAQNAIFAGTVHCCEVGSRHTEILDTKNEQFARHLTDCVKRARAAIQSAERNHPVAR